MTPQEFKQLEDKYLSENPPWASFADYLDLLEWQAARMGTRVSLRFPGPGGEARDYSFEQSLAEASRYGAALRARVGAGAAVAFIAETGPALTHAFLGALWTGIIPVVLAPPHGGASIGAQLERLAGVLLGAKVELLIADSELVDLLESSGAQLPKGIPAVKLQDLVLESQALAPAERKKSASEDIAFFQFTSGSTGRPKRVDVRNGALIGMIRALGRSLWIHPGDVSVNWLPFHHDMGMVGYFLTVAGHGACGTHIPARAFVGDIPGWLMLLSERKASFSGGPAFSFRLCERALKGWKDSEPRPDLSAMSRYICGGERVPYTLAGEFCEVAGRFGFAAEAFVPGYGLAENILGVSYKIPGTPTRHRSLGGQEIVSVGVPVEGCIPRIENENQERIADGELGEIVLDSAHAVEHPLRTGDLGFITDGEIHVVGRVRDVITHAGAKLAPEDLEEACAGIPEAGICAAVGVPSDVSATENIWIFAEQRGKNAEPAETARAEQAIAKAVSERSGASVHRIVWLAKGTLPRTSSGKLRRGELRSSVLSGKYS